MIIHVLSSMNWVDICFLKVIWRHFKVFLSLHWTVFPETLIWALTVHRLDGFYHNFFYTCPNDEIFYRLKVKTLLNIFLVLSFCKFGRLEAQKAPTPLGGRWTGSNASHPTGVGSNATPPYWRWPERQSVVFDCKKPGFDLFRPGTARVSRTRVPRPCMHVFDQNILA